MGLKLIDWTGRALRKAGVEMMRRNGIQGTWLDIGAHRGETTLYSAIMNPGLKVYALEANLAVAAKLMGRAANYFVIPMAVAEQDGFADFHINASEVASSLLPINEVSRRSWIGNETLKVESVVTVPTIRLDTLMRLTEMESVDYLKIDTQGMDLAVLRSAGSRLRDIAKVTLEVDVTTTPLYSGSPLKEEVIAFLDHSGFVLTNVERQTYGQEENLTFIRSDHAGRSSDGEASPPTRAERHE
jgi:FkbM family methyltransferase